MRYEAAPVGGSERKPPSDTALGPVPRFEMFKNRKCVVHSCTFQVLRHTTEDFHRILKAPFIAVRFYSQWGHLYGTPSQRK